MMIPSQTAGDINATGRLIVNTFQSVFIQTLSEEELGDHESKFGEEDHGHTWKIGELFQIRNLCGSSS